MSEQHPGHHVKNDMTMTSGDSQDEGHLMKDMPDADEMMDAPPNRGHQMDPKSPHNPMNWPMSKRIYTSLSSTFLVFA